MDSQITAIIKFLIKETPVGHLKSTLESLKTIIGIDFLDSPEIKKEISIYEEDHLKQVSIEEDKVLISNRTKDSEDNYFDLNKQLKFRNNPLSENLDNIDKYNSKNNSFRELIYKKLKEYTASNFKKGVVAINVFCNDDNSVYHILISAHNYNFKNYWSGEWLSLWKLNKENSMFVLTGDVKIATYYYEDGNVQFKLNKTFKNDIAIIDDKNELAKEIINNIHSNENTVQESLENIYDDLSENYLKPLRRRIPFTGVKMNWDLNQINFNN